MGIKIGIIGAGSSFTPDFFATLVEAGTGIDVKEVVLMDRSLAAAKQMARVSAKILRQAGRRIEIHATDRREEAISGANFVILEFRVGGSSTQVRDETLPVSLGMVGDEMLGAGGFAYAARNLTAAMEIAREIERLAPHAIVLCLANPSGMITEAILNNTGLRAIGFCNIPINMTCDLAAVLKVPPEKIQLDFIGLNHLGWIRGASIDGQECLQDVIAQTHTKEDALYRNGLVDRLMEPEFLHALGMLPAWYVRYYYFPEQTLREDRGREQAQASSRRLSELYETVGYNEEARRILVEKGGERIYLPAIQVIDSIVHNRGDVIVADVKNGIVIPDLPQETVVEVPVQFFQDREVPVRVGPLPLKIRSLVQSVKTYEQLAIQAILSGDRNLALLALMANPLVGSYERASAFLERMWENERELIPQFYR